MSAASSPSRRNTTLKLFSPDEFAAADADWIDGLSASMTLPEFGRVYVADSYYAETRASSGTVEILRTALSLWERLTPDRSLAEISDSDTAAFIAGLYTADERGKSRSPATVDKYRRAIQLCLNLAGPRTPRHKKAKGLIDQVTYLAPQEVPERDDVGDFSREEISAMLANCHRMLLPCEHDRTIKHRGREREILGTGIPPADWWHSLLEFAYNTAERRGALFGLGLLAADAAKVRFPANVRKGRKKSHELPLNDAARLALARALTIVRPDRKVLFPWPHHPRYFYTQFHKLQDFAGIPKERQHGLHGIRKATATEVAEFSPMGAQLILGHRDGTLLEKHYVNQKIKAEALAKLAPICATSGEGRGRGGAEPAEGQETEPEAPAADHGPLTTDY